MAAPFAPPDALRLEPIERLEDVRDEWGELAEKTGHPFATWEWNSLWWSRFGGGRNLHSFACRDEGGRIVAILPLHVAVSRPVGIARFLGYGDLMSPICAPEDRVRAADALLRATAREYGKVRLVLAERLPGGQGWGDLLGGRLLSAGHDPVLRFDGIAWDEFLASRSKNFRDQVRRRERKIVKETGLTFRLSDDPERVPGDMDTLFRLHGERWGGETTGVFAGSGGDFHKDFALAALERGWLRLWLAEIGGEPVAAWYGWRFAGSEWYYQAGRVEEHDRLSLGFVLLAHSIREACNEGVDAYRFLAGDEGYKSRFTEEDPGTESRVVGSGALASAGALAFKAGMSLPGPLRRRVTGTAD